MADETLKNTDINSSDNFELTPDSPQETLTFKGTSVCDGLAFGFAHTLTEHELGIPHFQIDRSQVRAESNRLRSAFNSAIKDLSELEESTEKESFREASAFIGMHLQILRDETIIDEVQDIIGEKLINAEWALSVKLEQIKDSFIALDDEYLSERFEDIEQVFDRVQNTLVGRRALTKDIELTLGNNHLILVAKSLDPTDVLILKRRYDESFAGLIVESGSSTSHTAILAQSLEIPMLVGVIGITDTVRNGDALLLDADHEIVSVNPDENNLTEVRARIRELNSIRARRKKLRTVTCQTVDGETIHLYANLALPDDVKDAVKFGADGVGLFRSEFLFMNRDNLPSEDEQYDAYSRVVRAMKGKPVTIRTVDLGGDKMLSEEAQEQLFTKDGGKLEANPALGRRALRLCRLYPELFDTQLRALLRAAVHGNMRILLPMVAHPSEIAFAKERLALADAKLTERGVKHASSVPLGGMIEVPAAAVLLESFLPMLDFISIGTNDLIQYTLAVDRHDASVNYLYNPWHPSVIRLIDMTVRSTKIVKKELCICGEVAGDPEMVRLLIGMGVRNFSMESVRMLAQKEKILTINCAEATANVNRIRHMHNIDKIIAALEMMRN